jgi:hypothetical protein
MDCVIKIVSGPETGREFRCSTAEAIVGRSPRSLVRLSSTSVSYEHAVITRKGDVFFLENLSANGTYLNNERITGKARLRAKDQFRMGNETMARVESVPASGGSGSSTAILWSVLGVMLLAMVVLVVWDPFSGTSQQNMRGAYGRLQEWTRQQAADGKLPRETPALFQEAWRLEMAGDRTNAAKAWVRLRVLLASTDNVNGYQSAAQADRRALSRLVSPEPKASAPGDSELGAALVQFVGQMERRQ